MTCSRHPKRAQSRASRLLWLFGTSRAREGLLASQRGVSPLVRPGALSPVQGLRPTRPVGIGTSRLACRLAETTRRILERPPLFPALEGRLPETTARRPLGPNCRNHGNAGTALSLVLRRLNRSTINARSNVRCWHLADISGRLGACPLSWVERTSPTPAPTSAYDPKRTQETWYRSSSKVPG